MATYTHMHRHILCILSVAMGGSRRRVESMVAKIPCTFASVIHLTIAYVSLFIHSDFVPLGFKCILRHT